MPSVSATADRKNSPAGDMSPFIIFMAFVILTTVIIMSIYRIKSEEDASIDPGGSGFTIALDAREPVVFSDDEISNARGAQIVEPLSFTASVCSGECSDVCIGDRTGGAVGAELRPGAAKQEKDRAGGAEQRQNAQDPP